MLEGFPGDTLMTKVKMMNSSEDVKWPPRITLIKLKDQSCQFVNLHPNSMNVLKNKCLSPEEVMEFELKLVIDRKASG